MAAVGFPPDPSQTRGPSSYSSPDVVLSYHLGFQSVAFGDLVMLDEEFRKQRARTVRDLAEKANDRFIKRRLLDLAARYEDEGPRPRTTLTPIDLQFASRGTGPERYGPWLRNAG